MARLRCGAFLSDALAALGVPNAPSGGRETVTLTRRTIPGGGMLITGTTDAPSMTDRMEPGLLSEVRRRSSMTAQPGGRCAPPHYSARRTGAPRIRRSDAAYSGRGHSHRARRRDARCPRAHGQCTSGTGRAPRRGTARSPWTVQWTEAGPPDNVSGRRGRRCRQRGATGRRGLDHRYDQSEETRPLQIAGMPRGRLVSRPVAVGARVDVYRACIASDIPAWTWEGRVHVEARCPVETDHAG